MDDGPVDEWAVLDRWVLHGGTIAVLTRSTRTVTVGLMRCDGGELVDSVELSAAAWDSRS